MGICAEDFRFITRAYKHFKNNESVNSYWEKRRNDEKYMDRLMTKGDWYYGETKFQFWSLGVMEMNLTEHAIIELTEKYSVKTKTT